MPSTRPTAPPSPRTSSRRSAATPSGWRRSSTARPASRRRTTSCPPSSTRRPCLPPITWRASTPRTCTRCTSACPPRTGHVHGHVGGGGARGGHPPVVLLHGEPVVDEARRVPALPQHGGGSAGNQVARLQPRLLQSVPRRGRPGWTCAGGHRARRRRHDPHRLELHLHARSGGGAGRLVTPDDTGGSHPGPAPPRVSRRRLPA